MKPADLPLNRRGAVYHLDLLPEELADTVITVGDPERVEQVSQRLDAIELKRTHREFVTHTGRLGTKRISVISTGIGAPVIDIVMNELDALINIDLQSRKPRGNARALTIIRLGTTGGIQKGCRIGDVIVSQYAIGFDSLLHFYDYLPSVRFNKLYQALGHYLPDFVGPTYVAQAHQNLLDKMHSLGKVAVTATLPGFYGPQNRILRHPIRYPQLLEALQKFECEDLNIENIEMETAAIYGMGHILNHQCLSLSVVIANRYTGEFSSNIHIEIDGFLEKALARISVL